jgi:hypothetical protein
MEALHAFAESVGYKGDIMEGVVTKCAGGVIEEIHWNAIQDRRIEDITQKCFNGTLPAGDLHMPKLRWLNLSKNPTLKGEG